jgi:ribosomal-protein-alanine N-acetyltransferase
MASERHSAVRNFLLLWRVVIRDASEQDLPAIAAVQSAAAEASQWNPGDYLTFECRVAERDCEVVGFVVARAVAGECEILNLAVAPRARRQGVGRQLLSDVVRRHPGEFYLEVRASNQAARRFYEQLGFREITKRLQYYANPVEPAIVMKLYSC